MFEKIPPEHIITFLKIVYSSANYAMKNKLATEVDINRKRIDKIEEKLEIESKDYDFEKITEYDLKKELESELNLEVIDSGKVRAGEYFRIKYLDKCWQICFGELKMDVFSERDMNENKIENSLTFTFEHPIPYKKIYFVFPNDPKFKVKNLNEFNFDVKIKFDNERDLKEFKENKEKELNKINYFSFGEWG